MVSSIFILNWVHFLMIILLLFENFKDLQLKKIKSPLKQIGCHKF